MATPKVTPFVSPAQAIPLRSFVRANRVLAAKYANWLVAQNYSTNTRRAYDKIVRQFYEHLGAKSLLETEHLDVREFLGELQAHGCSGSTLARELHGLRNFFDFLNLGGLLASCPPRLIRTRKVARRLPRFQIGRAHV